MATKQPHIRAVKPGEPGQGRPKQSVAQAAASGDHLATLIATRDRVAVAISDPKCSPRDLAALTKRLDDIIEKIKTFEVRAAEEHDVDDDVGDQFDASAI